MMRSWYVVFAGTFLALFCPVLSGRLNADQLITNGGFESGLAGWTVVVQDGSDGAFFALSGAIVPSGNIAVGPASGSLYAVSDQFAPTAAALLQSFTVPGPA